jgi:hypothetical protein
MRNLTLVAVPLALLVGLAPVFAQDASASEEDIFGQAEAVTTTTEQTQNTAPRDEILTSAVPWITGTFTGKVGVNWSWSDIWNSGFDLLDPTSHGLTQSSTALRLGFVARPDKDISITSQIRTGYPFVKQIDTGAVAYTVPDLTVWSLYSKFSWKDTLFFSFGKQPIKWGTGYFFSPADDIFALSAVDITDPTAEREGPLGLKIHYPIPRTMDNLYFFAMLPSSNDPAVLADMLPEDIAVAGKAEFLFGNTEVALAGYYQRQQRLQAILMGTTGFGNLNFFAEGTAAFANPSSDPYLTLGATTWPPTGSSNYTVVDRKGDVLFCATAGGMYTNSDGNFTVVGQYLYNGYGYASLTLSDLLQATLDRAIVPNPIEPAWSFASLANSLGGLGKIGQHYGVVYLSWSGLWKTDLGFSVLSIANFSDGSGYVQPTLSYKCLSYVTLSASTSFSWGGEGTEFADPAGLIKALSEGDLTYQGKPTMSFTLAASIGTKSF